MLNKLWIEYDNISQYTGDKLKIKTRFDSKKVLDLILVG